MSNLIALPAVAFLLVLATINAAPVVEETPIEVVDFQTAALAVDQFLSGSNGVPLASVRCRAYNLAFDMFEHHEKKTTDSKSLDTRLLNAMVVALVMDPSVELSESGQELLAGGRMISTYVNLMDSAEQPAENILATANNLLACLRYQTDDNQVQTFLSQPAIESKLRSLNVEDSSEVDPNVRSALLEKLQANCPLRSCEASEIVPLVACNLPKDGGLMARWGQTSSEAFKKAKQEVTLIKRRLDTKDFARYDPAPLVSIQSAQKFAEGWRVMKKACRMSQNPGCEVIQDPDIYNKVTRSLRAVPRMQQLISDLDKGQKIKQSAYLEAELKSLLAGIYSRLDVSDLRHEIARLSPKVREWQVMQDFIDADW